MFVFFKKKKRKNFITISILYHLEKIPYEFGILPKFLLKKIKRVFYK